MKRIIKIEEDVKINNNVILEKGDIIHVKEAINYGKDEIGQALNYAIEELESSISAIRNPENWAEKYVVSANGLIKKIEDLSNIFSKIR